jgi:hypothetical protein
MGEEADAPSLGEVSADITSSPTNANDRVNAETPRFSQLKEGRRERNRFYHCENEEYLLQVGYQPENER